MIFSYILIICGGNVYDSNAAAEYEEIQRKLAGTRKVMDLFAPHKNETGIL